MLVFRGVMQHYEKRRNISTSDQWCGLLWDHMTNTTHHHIPHNIRNHWWLDFRIGTTWQLQKMCLAVNRISDECAT